MLRKYIIAVDLGGTNLRLALLNSNYKILRKSILSTRDFIKKEELINSIVFLVKQLIRDKGLKRNNILGVGIGLPGPIDVAKGIVHFFPNIPGWRNVKIRAILERKLHLPVSIDNDVNLMALAEFRRGNAKGSNNAVCLTLGTGVGGGIIINQRLYRGSTYAAGEIGHIPVNLEGPGCSCGGKACLESYIGNKRIIKEANKLFGCGVSLEELSRLARRKDKRAIKVWSLVAKYLGTALSGVVNFLNPDVIVIGGGVANAGKVLFKRTRDIVSKQAMPIQSKRVKILKAKLGNDAGLIGAGILVKEGFRV